MPDRQPEQWIKEGKPVTHWTWLSCDRFRANEVRLQLSVLAYNLGNVQRPRWQEQSFCPTNQFLQVHIVESRLRFRLLRPPTEATGIDDCWRESSFSVPEIAGVTTAYRDG